MKIILIVLSFSNSFQSWVRSSYKIKVSDSASRRLDSVEVSRQSKVDVPRWSLRFTMGGQWILRAPLMCAELKDRNERQSITVHFWLSEPAMLTTVSGARGQINSWSSITTIVFDSMSSFHFIYFLLRCRSKLTKIFIPFGYTVWRAIMIQLASGWKILHLYSRPKPAEQLFLALATSLIRRFFVLSCCVSRTHALYWRTSNKAMTG